MKQFLPKSLFGRSLLILIIPVLVIQIVTTVIFFDRHWSKMTSRVSVAVAGEIAMITEGLEREEDLAKATALREAVGRNLSISVVFEKGAELGPQHQIRNPRVWDSYVAQSLLDELKKRLRRPFVLDIDFEEKWVRVSVQITNGVVTVALPGSRLFSSSGYVFLLWVFSASVVLLVIAVLFMRSQIRPIRRLAKAAEQFGRGQEVEKFSPSGAREIRQATQAFWDMQERISSYIKQRSLMLAGVSHDLRTPLTRMKLQLSMLPESADVEALRQDINDMERMIKGYLDFVGGREQESLQDVYISQMIERLCENVRKKFPKISVSFYMLGTLAEEGEGLIAVRPLALERCLINILENAGRYGKTVEVNCHWSEQGVLITVDDDGPGVPEDKRVDLFKPFFRLDQSRNSEKGGTGLGLSIAQDVVISHGGDITLNDSPLGGLRVELFIPQ